MSGQIGRSLPRVEGHAKVTGAAEYIHNLRLPGMLYGKIARSTVPHGRIARIDTTAANAIAGIHRIVTAADIRAVIAEPYYGPAFHDQPILAEAKVRHVGEPVAVALAADPHVAEEAAQAIAVEYEPLPAVFDEVEAVTSAAIVHDALKPAGTALAGRCRMTPLLEHGLLKLHRRSREGGNPGLATCGCPGLPLSRE